MVRGRVATFNTETPVVSFSEVSWKCSILAPSTAVTATAIEHALAGARYKARIKGVLTGHACPTPPWYAAAVQEAESTGSNCISIFCVRVPGCSVVPLAFILNLGCRFRIRTDSVEGRIRTDSGGFREASTQETNPQWPVF
jgi:hypothetical protein